VLCCAHCAEGLVAAGSTRAAPKVMLVGGCTSVNSLDPQLETRLVSTLDPMQWKPGFIKVCLHRFTFNLYRFTFNLYRFTCNL
jgi:hypothetical protein